MKRAALAVAGGLILALAACVSVSPPAPVHAIEWNWPTSYEVNTVHNGTVDCIVITTSQGLAMDCLEPQAVTP